MRVEEIDIRRFALIFSLFGFLSGCFTGSQHEIHSVSKTYLEGGYCSTATFSGPSTLPPSSPQPFPQIPESSIEVILSPQSEEIANIIGVTELVQQIYKLNSKDVQSEEGIREARIDARQHLSDRLLLSTLEISSITSEVDCEQTRTQHVVTAWTASQLDRTERHLQFAILGDAIVGGIFGGALALGLLDTASAVAAIVGGTITTGLSLAASFDDVQGDFQHERNLLREVWEGPEESEIFPGPVWQFLNAPGMKDGDPTKTRRERLILDWRKHRWLGEPDSEERERRVELFFGDGGTYGTGDLRVRAQMLGFLKTYINLMHRRLNELIREVLTSAVLQ